jgi:hypothetical protein
MDHSAKEQGKQHRGDDETGTTCQSGGPPMAPTTDPTNPHNQEETGDWVANSRASDRRNNEPGLAHKDRQQRTN